MNNIDKLMSYLETQIPECKVVSNRKSDLGVQRFYFRVGSKSKYVLQISDELLDDSSLESLEAKLERSRLQRLFSEHPEQIVALGQHGISFLPKTA